MARHDSYLPGGVHITRGKLRGESSEGMLCSLTELNLEERDFPGACENGIFILPTMRAPGKDHRGQDIAPRGNG